MWLALLSKDESQKRSGINKVKLSWESSVGYSGGYLETFQRHSRLCQKSRHEVHPKNCSDSSFLNFIVANKTILYLVCDVGDLALCFKQIFFYKLFLFLFIDTFRTSASPAFQRFLIICSKWFIMPKNIKSVTERILIWK